MWPGIFLSGEWRSAEREDIKRAVRDRTIRLVVATDAACEGLNLQTLGTLINFDLPCNPSRLEQRIGRIANASDRRGIGSMTCSIWSITTLTTRSVYQAPSRGGCETDMTSFGSLLPDTIEDDWIEDIEHLDDYLSQFTEKKVKANAVLNYATEARSSRRVPGGRSASKYSAAATSSRGYQKAGESATAPTEALAGFSQMTLELDNRDRTRSHQCLTRHRPRLHRKDEGVRPAKTLLAGHATIGAWSKGGKPWRGRIGTRARNGTGGGC